MGTGIHPSELTPRRVSEAVVRAAKDATEKARALGESLRDVDGARDGAHAILRFLDRADRYLTSIGASRRRGLDGLRRPMSARRARLLALLGPRKVGKTSHWG